MKPFPALRGTSIDDFISMLTNTASKNSARHFGPMGLMERILKVNIPLPDVMRMSSRTLCDKEASGRAVHLVYLLIEELSFQIVNVY